MLLSKLLYIILLLQSDSQNWFNRVFLISADSIDLTTRKEYDILNDIKDQLFFVYSKTSMMAKQLFFAVICQFLFCVQGKWA